MEIKNSINIKYDYSSVSLIDSYYSTSAHSKLIKGVLSGALDLNNNKSHIAFGAYGSGKSYISSLLLGIVTKTYKKKHIKLLADKFRDIDNTVSLLLDEYNKTEIKYFPIVINGNEGDINNVIISQLAKLILDNNIRFSIPGHIEAILSITSKWKKEYPLAHDKFVNLLSNHLLSENDFMNLLYSDLSNATELFKNIYKEISYGGELYLNSQVSFVNILEELCKQLAQRNLGVFLVYDEFGRYLQNLEENEILKFMQEMQNISELANNGLKNLSILFITHRPMGHYFIHLDRIYRSEFAKIEKRYSIYEIKSDYITFIKICSNYINQVNIDDNVDQIEIVFSDTRKFGLYNGIVSDDELKSTITRKMFPLHPLTSFLLPKVSTIYGQNERTLFTFLNDESSLGLKGFINNEDGFYYADSLIDYFFTNIDLSYIEDIKEYTIYESSLKKIRSNIGASNHRLAQRIYKLVLIWTITNSTGIIKINEKFLSYALGANIEQIGVILEEMAFAKLLRFNTIESQWEMFEGSSLDINSEITKIKAKEKINNIKLIEILNQLNPYRYIYSDQYNNRFEVTRFSELFYILNDEDENLSETQSDIKIPLYFNKRNPVNNNLHAVIHSSFDEITPLLERFYYLNFMLNYSFYTNNYMHLDVEINFELEKIQNDLNKFFSNLFNDSTFYYNCQLIKFADYNNLSNYLSNYFFEIYPNTIKIVNDQINMYTLTKIQNSALNMVIDKVLYSSDSDLCQTFTGTKPSDLIYYTVIENIYHIEGNRVSLDLLKTVLFSYLDDNPSESLFNLIKIAIAPPYGTRPKVAILLCLYLIRTKWKDILLFRNDTFIPSISSEELVEELINKPNNIRYQFSRFDNLNREFIEKLSEIFVDQSEGVANKSLSVKVCSGMHNWYYRLPVITQQLEEIGPTEKRFLQIIAKSRINPEEAITTLMGFSNDVDDIMYLKNSVENHFSHYLANFQKRLFEEIGFTSFDTFMKSIPKIAKKTNKFIEALGKGCSIFDAYSDQIDNIEIQRWTKSSFINLRNMVINDVNKLNDNVRFDRIEINGVERVVQQVELSKKAQNTLENIVNLFEATKKYMSPAEIEVIALTLARKYVRE